MHLSQFHIENFKLFDKVTLVDLHSDLNVLTGVNNSGKTTVLEAMMLWNECFQRLLVQAHRADSQLGIRSNDYMFQSNHCSAKSVVSLKMPSYESIFHDLDQPGVYLEATLSKGDDNLSLGFMIKSGKGEVYTITLENAIDYPKFNQFFKTLPSPISMIYISPLASLIAVEEFKTEPNIAHDLRSRQSSQVLRNRLYRLYYQEQDNLSYVSFLADLKYILLNNQDVLNDPEEIKFDFRSSHQEDIEVLVQVKIGHRTPSIDISLLGSGTLQIIGILLSCYEKRKELGIILLDEPDSHIHRDLQKRLLTILLKHASQKQIFLTTHNESLIRSTPPTHLFHLQVRSVAEYRPVMASPYPANGPRSGLQPSYQIKILEALGSESALDYLNAIEADKLLLVEGREDAQYIQTILRNRYQRLDQMPTVMYWAFGGIDNLLTHLKAYQSFFSQIRNQKSLWDKAMLVFDKDRITDTQRHRLMTALTQKLKVKVYIWSAYTIEATILTDLENFALLLYKYAKVLDKDVKMGLQEFKGMVHEEIDRLISKKTQVITADDSRKELHHYLLSRKEKLWATLEIKEVIRGADGALSPEATTETLNALEQGELYRVASKSDIHQLITTLFSRLNITLSREIENYFTEMLTLARYSPWFAEWDRMIDVLESTL